MYCRWCGMDSRDEKICEWCRKSLTPEDRAAPSETVSMAPRQEPVRQETPPAQEPVPVGYNPRQGSSRDDEPEDEEKPFETRLRNYLFVMIPIVLIGGTITYFQPVAVIVTVIITCAFSGFFLGFFNLIGYYDDLMPEMTAVLISVTILGPLYAMIAYIVVNLVRQNTDRSLVWLLGSFAVINLINYIALSNVKTALLGILIPTLDCCSGLLLNLAPVSFMFGGWMLSNFFRPVNAK